LLRRRRRNSPLRRQDKGAEERKAFKYQLHKIIPLFSTTEVWGFPAPSPEVLLWEK
jgi:hypothetical protein